MNHKLFGFSGVVAVFLSACGGSSTPPPDNSGSTSPSASSSNVAHLASASAAQTATTAPNAGTNADAKPADAKPKGLVHDADGPDGVRRWALWDGPKSGKTISTKKAWVLAPNTSGQDSKVSFKSTQLTLVTLVKSDENEAIFEHRGNKYAVPAALARAAEPPKALKKGAFVFCSFGGSYALARVEAVDAKSVTCLIRFMDKTRKETVAPDEVLELEGPLGISAPAFVRFEQQPNTQYIATILATLGEDTWVAVNTQFDDSRADRSMHRVKTKDVTAIDVSKPLAKGARCLAKNIASVNPCTVKTVIDGGLAYVVRFGDAGSGGQEEREIGTVAPAPITAK